MVAISHHQLSYGSFLHAYPTLHIRYSSAVQNKTPTILWPWFRTYKENMLLAQYMPTSKFYLCHFRYLVHPKLQVPWPWDMKSTHSLVKHCTHNCTLEPVVLGTFIHSEFQRLVFVPIMCESSNLEKVLPTEPLLYPFLLFLLQLV